MVSVWEAIFMLVVLKIPLVYLGIVIWWAVRAEPTPADGHETVGALVPLTPCGWGESRRRRSPRLGPSPIRPRRRSTRRAHAGIA